MFFENTPGYNAQLLEEALGKGLRLDSAESVPAESGDCGVSNSNQSPIEVISTRFMGLPSIQDILDARVHVPECGSSW